MRQGKCCRLSTQGIPGEDAWCPEAVFVRGRRYFCGCGKGNVAACPRRGCLVRTHGARRRLLSTGGGVFVDAAREMLPPVHAGGAWCGRMVLGGGFCPREEVFLWMRQGKCCRLSTQGVPGEDAWCPEAAFVHGRRCFCGCGNDWKVLDGPGDVSGKIFCFF